jgi:Tfp pilus assembly protein PilZ
LGIPLPVEFECAGLPVTGVAGNISRGGVYVRTDASVAMGELIKLNVALPDGSSVTVTSRAVHSLAKRAAQAMGRCAGVGFRFVDEGSPALRAIASLIDEVASEVAPPLSDVAEPFRLVVASGDARLRDRLTTVLAENGYAVEVASNAFEAYVLCLERTPDLIVAGEYMASLDGPTLAVQSDQGKASVKILRLKKPFTDEDLCEHVAAALAQEVRRSSLRANLREIALGSLLSFLESAHKTGVVTAVRGEVRVELHLRQGRIVRIMNVDEANARSCLLELLDWTEGTFQFYVCPIVERDQLHFSMEMLRLQQVA